jgi:hypothetical protein
MVRETLVATAALIVSTSSVDRGWARCTGDCDADGRVAVAELVSGVSIALARSALGACAAMDADADLGVSVSELTAAIGYALDGCPAAPPPGCDDPLAAERYRECVRTETEPDCLNAGGEWGPYPYSGMAGCFCPTGQGSCPCGTSDDCLSLCIAPDPGGVLDICADTTVGRCADNSVVAGCFCSPYGSTPGFAWICIDP